MTAEPGPGAPTLQTVAATCLPPDAARTGLYEVEITSPGAGGQRRRVYRRWVADRQCWMTTDGALSPVLAATQGWRLVHD